MNDEFKVRDNMIEKYNGSDAHVTVPEQFTGIDYSAFFGKDFIVSVQIDALIEKIKDGTFGYCKKLRQISLPATIENIGENAFEMCKSLEEIMLPQSLISIGKSAFRSCSALKRIAIPIGTKSIGTTAFKFCKALEQAYIPKTVKKIGKDAFAKCPALTIVTVKSSYAEKYALAENIPVQLVPETELISTIESLTVLVEDLMALKLKMAQRQGPAALVTKGKNRILVKNQIIYERSEGQYRGESIPQFYPQSENYCYIKDRESIEKKATELKSEFAVGYLAFNKEKIVCPSDEEAKKIFDDFAVICHACKNPEFLAYLCNFLPVKKDGSLHVRRKLCIAALPLLRHGSKQYADMRTDFSYDLVARVESETEVTIEIDRFELTTQAEEDYYSFHTSKAVLSFEEMAHKAKEYV